MSDDDGRDQRTTVMHGYDELAAVYADERERFEDDEILDALLADAPDGRILDAGCGAGDPVLDGIASERPVLGLDFSSEQVRLADDVAPGRVVSGDMTALPVADDSVGVVDDLGDDADRDGDNLVDPDADEADKLFLFARLDA